MVSGDHPRVCGEKCQLYAKPSVSVGSPPRMRGKEAEQAPASEHSRITPAYAGKSYPAIFGPGYLRDHPRVCGEKYLVASEVFLCKGSPPRMRGKVPLCSADCLRPGITPAYAGKRGRNKSGQPAAKDHPRVCGEKNRGICPPLPVSGSPPRMRGKD